LYTSVENIQVWIDPLDATQEYSGLNWINILAYWIELINFDYIEFFFFW
jgi:hypothetical protein